MPRPEELPIRQDPVMGTRQVSGIEDPKKLEESSGQTLDKLLNSSWEKALTTESYEEADMALGRLKMLRQWRGAASNSKFKDFYTLFEQVSQVEGSVPNPSERISLRNDLVELLAIKAQSQSPRIADLYQAILAEVDGTSFKPRFESTTEKIKSLKDSGDLASLLSPTVPFDIKLNRFKTRLEGELIGRRALDRRDRQQQEATEISDEETAHSEPQTPPPVREESKPSMDEMQRTPEGEPVPAIWTITPAWGGYYKGRSFDRWDSSRNVWQREVAEYTEVQGLGSLPSVGEGNIQMQANVLPGQWIPLDIPYSHQLAGVQAESGTIRVRRDQNGDYLLSLQAEIDTPVSISIFLSARETPLVLTQETTPETLNFNSQFSPETLAQFEAVRERKLGNIARARALSRLVKERLKYSNDSSLNAVYEAHPGGYIAAIDEYRQADCDVANTYFAAACAVLNIPVRHVTGHMVKGKDNEGNARITSGTGHAWSEVWDEERHNWERIDATPPGDPQLDEEEATDGEPAPGDYGEQEAVGPTDEQLRELEEKLAKHTEELSYTPEERELAEVAGIELKEARDIQREITAAEETRLPSGERVVDVMAKIFSLIIESRRTLGPQYTGPLRKREGGEYIDDVVSHVIGMRSGDLDPASRQKETELPNKEEVFGGIDLYFIGDKSGSMGETVDGEKKWQLQRRAEYLVLSSLYRFQRNLEAASNHLADPLSVRTQAISFRDSSTIDEDKPLSGNFSAHDKVSLWRSLGNQGYGNGDMAALSYVHGEIAQERQVIEAESKKDNRLRVVIACSDGYPDNVTGVHQYAEALGKMNTVVVGVGLTETAAAVPQIFDTPYSRGDIARDINDLPLIVAKHVVQEAIKLFPEKTRATQQAYLESVIHKFERVA